MMALQLTYDEGDCVLYAVLPWTKSYNAQGILDGFSLSWG